jgi:hypothetical protein
LCSGYFRVEEIFDYDQEDLIEDDVMILDTYAEVFVWIGKGANTEEKTKALETVITYIKSDTSGRTVADTVTIVVKQGFEPPQFTCHFFAWDAEKWSNGKTYEQLKAELAAGGASVASVSASAMLSTLTNAVYTYAQLKASPLPEGVDATRKERYLSDDEFKSVMGVTKEEFSAMPKWKADGIKKKVGLY